MREFLILCICFSLVFSAEILSLSVKEKRGMKNDFAVLDNAYSNGYTEHFIEFAERFLERYKLASVDKDDKIRQIYNSVKISVEAVKSEENFNVINLEHQDTIKDDKELQKLFSSVLLGTTEDIIQFINKYPDYRTKDIHGALERARVNDLSTILASINRKTIPTNEIIRFAELHGDTVSIEKIKIAAQKLVTRNTSLLWDFRAVFGITDFEEKVEQILYQKIMNENEYNNLVAYIEFFPEGKYIKFVSDLVANYK